MVDTLKLARRLEEAGLDRRVAEATAEAFADSTVETIATKQDLRQEVAVLRSEIEATGQALRAEIKATAQALRAEIEASAQTLRAEMAAMAQTLRAEMQGMERSLRSEMQAYRWQVIAAVALMLLVHLGGVWGIIATHVP